MKNERDIDSSNYNYLIACQDPSTGELTDDSFMDIYLTMKPDHREHSEMLKVVFDTVIALKILRERFYMKQEECKMVARKGYVTLKRRYFFDPLAVDRIIESIEDIEYN